MFALFLGNSRIRTPATHRTVVQTAHSDARTCQDCGNVAAGQAERHAEVAHNYGNDYGPNFGLKRSQTQFSGITGTRIDDTLMSSV